MVASARYRQLSSRLTELRHKFLPRTFDPTGTYPARQDDKTRAYRLLAHAEIEDCLEDMVVDVANNSYNDWLAHGRINRTIVALVAYREGRFKHTHTPGSIDELRLIIEDAKAYFVGHVIESNHGIRKRNITSLLLPTGLAETEIDQTWVNATDGFGARRGETAHRSSRAFMAPDPKTELLTVRQIRDGIRALDVKLQRL